MSDVVAAFRRRMQPVAPKPNGQFSAKLQFVQRCQIFAFARFGGVKRELLARAFGVHRATVRHIINDSSKHYRDVRKEFKDLGEEDFLLKYMTPDAEAFILSFKGDVDVDLSDDALEDANAANRTVANSRADSKKGEHKAWSRMYEIPVTLSVSWFPEGRNMYGQFGPPGWYATPTIDEANRPRVTVSGDLDPLFPLGDAQSCRTSGAALAYALEELFATYKPDGLAFVCCDNSTASPRRVKIVG